MDKTLKLSRRNFMKTSAATIAGLGLHVIQKSLPVFAQNIPQATKLGRVAVGGDGAHFDLKLKPDMYSNSVGQVFHDDIIPWYREVAASGMDLNSVNQRWIETDGGYIYAGYVQPVKDIKNQPITSLPNYGTTPGMWVEITVPYSDLTLDGPTGLVLVKAYLLSPGVLWPGILG